MHHRHVSAGSVFVGQSQPLVLEAYLSTCVGVAVADEDAGVGGMGHFLLPEPSTASAGLQPEKYASSGLPLLLQAIVEGGGRPERMRATIAGGALIGPIDDLDLSLNIGGRTTEIVEDILGKGGIEVAAAETGGLFTSCLTLRMQDWSCRIEPAGFESMEPESTDRAPTAEDIDRAMESIQPVPQAALKIMRLIEEGGELDIRTLTQEIRQDQVISARTLQLANSVMFARRPRIESLDHALMYLGLNLLMKYVVAAAVEVIFSRSISGYSLCKGGLYHHAVGTAVISEKLARASGAVRPGLAYAAGLLHDIGKVVLDQFIDSARPFIYRRLSALAPLDFTQSEQALFEVDHTEVGFRLARRWRFPEGIAAAIRHHHEPEAAGSCRELAHVVHLADILMARFRPGLEMEQMHTEKLASRLAAIGLTLPQYVEIVDTLPESFFHAAPESAIGA